MQQSGISAHTLGVCPLSFLVGLVDKIAQGDPAAVEQLYGTLIKGLRTILSRQLPPDLASDRAHDAFLVIVDAIHSGQLRDAARLPAFVRTVAQRQIVDAIRCVTHSRSRDSDTHQLQLADRRIDPEQELAHQKRVTCLRSALASLSPRDREMLTRFYLDEQDSERICREMNLTPSQFRLCKSRAKGRLTEAALQDFAHATLFRLFNMAS